ncbi:EamA family transporter [Candidatus Uhrbacteria bacterium]|nr:EamA family transporter [Candidatus Uhrbacteria bacterium]
METGFIFAIAASVTWGLVYTFDQKLLTHVSPVTYIFIGSIITPILLLPFILKNGGFKEMISSGADNIALIVLCSILALTADFFILSGIKNLDASTASIIEISYPFFVVLFSFIFFRSSPNIYFFIGGLLVFLGSVIIVKFA